MDGTKRLSLILFIIVGGFAGIIAQTTLLRELLVAFSGNELSIGVILGSWIVWEAVGALLGGGLKKEYHIDILILSTLFFAIAFPGTIYVARVFKPLAGILPGVGVGIVPIIYSSFVILFPAGLLHGLFFTLSCAIYNEITNLGAPSTGKVYFYETMGTIVGGVLVCFIFIPRFNSFFTAISAGLVCAVFSVVLAKSLKGLSRSSAGVGSGTVLFSSVIVLVIAAISLMTGWPERLHESSLKKMWAGMQLVWYENSSYQNIAVVKNENQFTFFSDGVPIITTPTPDIAFTEEFAHFPLLSHPGPEKVLVLGGGAGGLIRETLKHRTIEKTTYVELDPLLLKTLQRFPTPLTEGELNNPRVALHYVDGKTFVNETKERYDVILLNMPLPRTLQVNRFFTEEFFRSIKGVLNSGGIIAFPMTGSLAYYNTELKELNGTIMKTLGLVFPSVYVLPGDFNLFMASPTEGTLRISPSLLVRRFSDREIETDLITPPHIEHRMEEYRQKWFRQNVDPSSASLNSDFSPKALFHALSQENLLFSPYMKPFFDTIKTMGLPVILASMGFIFLALLVLRKRFTLIALPFSIASTGFAVMALELILIFVFQIFHGYIFFEIGILITVFMAGMALGSLVASSKKHAPPNPYGLLLLSEAALVIFSLILPFVLGLVGAQSFQNSIFVKVFIYISLFITGAIAGIEFPLSNRIYLESSFSRKSPNILGKTAGILYGADLLGGWVGGLVGGLLLLPVMGLKNGCFALAFLKATSFLLLLTLPKK